MRVNIGDIAAAFGKGIFAGVAGTAVMTISSTIEMKLRGRPASSAPAQAEAKVLGVQPIDEEREARFSNVVYWGYGSVWGGARGLLVQPLWWQPCISAFPLLTDSAYGAASSCLRVSPLAALMAFTVSVRRPISARFAVLALLRCW
jgi:hypothetical protein